MKKTVFSILSFVLVSVMALSATSLSWMPMMQVAQPTSTPSDQKVIKDPAEYNAYIAALNTKDPSAKGAAIEAFVKQYPNSIVKSDALDQALVAYQQANNEAKLIEIARESLQLNPSNVRTLAVLTALMRAKATQGDAQALAGLQKDATAGINALSGWKKPDGLSDADAAKLLNQLKDIFYGALGFALLQQKNYGGARDAYLQAVQIDGTNLQDVYQLGLASLSLKPIDIKGFWYIAKAANLAKGSDSTVKAINDFGKGQYRYYHGTEDGWDAIVTAAAAQTAPAADFFVKAKPTAAELACQAASDNDPTTLSFADWEYILQFRDSAPCNKDAAAKVWAAIQAKENDGKAKLKIPVKVISATKDTITAAITDDNQQKNTADLTITMEKPLLHPPAAGATIDIIGVISDYTPQPFTFVMTGGEVAAKTPVHAGAHK